jgi:HEPN domain-containing protein
VTWQPGRDRVQELLDEGGLERNAPDVGIARHMLDDAIRHLSTASAALSMGDRSGAYQLAYDALRKSAASLLEAQGLRATSRGGHIAVQEAITAQFGAVVRDMRSFGRIRRARNSFEYPNSESAGPSADDVTDAITVATRVCDAATRILDQDVLTRWTG